LMMSSAKGPDRHKGLKAKGLGLGKRLRAW
jgi:hypothetical protein